jgi:hypothetical protein
MRPDWFPDWSGQVCAVIASGESAKSSGVERLQGRCKAIVVNSSYRLAPWADALYASDWRWWDAYRDALEFQGLKVTSDAGHAKRLGIRSVAVARETDPTAHSVRVNGPIGHGGNSGFQAINLAVQFGVRRLVLVGFDLQGGHWHEKHSLPLINPRPQTLDKWRQRLDGQAEPLRRLGVVVVNASETSALQAFPKMSIDEALVRWHVAEDK